MNASTVSLRNLSSDAAHAAVAAAVAHARTLGVRVNVAAVDAAGTLMAFQRMDGAFLHSIDIAIDKAYTAASFGFPTEGWAALIEGDATLRACMPARPRLVVLGGGVPVYEGAQQVGAIGVSGATAEQDAVCARAAIAAIGLNDEPR